MSQWDGLEGGILATFVLAGIGIGCVLCGVCWGLWWLAHHIVLQVMP